MKPKWIFLLVMVLFYGTNLQASGKTLIYRSATEDKSIIITERIETGENGIVITQTRESGETYITVCNPDYSTKSWEMVDPQRKTRLTVERLENIIQIRGLFKGREIVKEVKVDGRILNQMWDAPLAAWIRSDKKTLEFWTVRPTDLKEFVMLARKEAEETIRVNNDAMAAVKVKLSVSGWMAKFWSVYYWFRKSDGLFIRYEGMEGPPGTPKTIMEVIDENG